MTRLFENAAGEMVPLWMSFAEPMCHECMVALMDEEERIAFYHELVAGGLSDYEARGSVWPEIEGCAVHDRSATGA